MSECSYDSLPYESYPFARTHPDYLYCLGKLFGLEPNLPSSAKVLEVGCAAGNNLIPMAYTLPKADFVGVDLSEVQINQALETTKKLKLKNIKFLKDDFRNVSGVYDYIILHGVISWVSEEVRDGIIKKASELLGENGLVYFSYNTYPGWHQGEVLRGLMRFHSGRFKEPGLQVAQSRAMLGFYSEVLERRASDYSKSLKIKVDYLRKMPDWYLFHDLLEESNQPFYFSEFVGKLSDVNMSYLADVEIASMADYDLTDSESAELRKISPDEIDFEQYLDFIRNRMHRGSVFFHANHSLTKEKAPARIPNFSFSSPCALVDGVFVHPERGEIETSDELIIAALTHLHHKWPEAVGFSDLVSAARLALGRRDEKSLEDDQVNVASTLFQCFMRELLYIHGQPLLCRSSVSDKPLASGLCRGMAEDGNRVTNLRHEHVTFDEFGIFLLRQLDGTKSVSELAKLAKDSGLLEGDYEKEVEDTLQVFARQSCLVA